MAKVALVAGSTGMIGQELVTQLCADPVFGKVVALVRRAGNFNHPKVEELVVSYDRLEDYAALLKVDVVFSCLGTTQKQTPDRKAYFAIDHDYPLKLAGITQGNGAAQFHIVSSIGAKAGAAGFYLSMKGKTEQDIAAVPFASVHIYRPSFLEGNRKEQRLLEKAALGFFALLKPLLAGKLRKYRSITGHNVARAMIAQSGQDVNGVFYYESDEIQRLADQIS